MNRPAGDNSGGPDLLDALGDIQDKLRSEFDQKLEDLKNDLLKRIEEVEKESRDTDKSL